MLTTNKAKFANRRKFHYGMLSTAAVLAAAHLAAADNFTWLGTGSTDPNPTFWDLTALNWNDTTTTTTPVAWTQGGAATFAGAATAVALQNTDIFATNIIFSTGGWNISSAGTGTLQFGSTGTIVISNGTGLLNTISAAIADTPTFVTSVNYTGGNGTMTVSGVNTYSGTTSFTGGWTAFSNDNQLGTGTGAGNIRIDGASILAASSFEINSGRGITIGNVVGGSNGQLSAAANQTLTFGGVIADAGGTGNQLVIGTGSGN